MPGILLAIHEIGLRYANLETNSSSGDNEADTSRNFG